MRLSRAAIACHHEVTGGIHLLLAAADVRDSRQTVAGQGHAPDKQSQQP
jgi:hypothetical protein